MGFPTELEVASTVEDTSAPEVTDFDFSPTTIDVGTGPQDITFTLQITDDISGVERASVVFVSPSGQHGIGNFVGPSDLILGDTWDGIYQGTITFPQFSEEGTWHIDNISVEDSIGNKRWYYETELISMGFPTELEVVYEPSIEGILEFFDQAVAAGTLIGLGPGNSANGRLYALRNMLTEAGMLIDSGFIEEACAQLAAARNKCDGVSPPPDFVAGPAASELYDMILDLMEELECG